MPAGPWWDWVDSIDSLFDPTKRFLSSQFIAHLQPVFDKLKLNVQLSQVRIVIGGGNFTKYYDVNLETQNEHSITDQVLSALLHELGHVVQYVNLPWSKWQTKVEVTDPQDGTVLFRRSEEQAKIAWIFEENDANKKGATHLWHNEMLRYDQDVYLKSMPLDVLAGTYLLGRYSLDAQCERFRDLLLSLPAAPKK